MPPTFSSLGVPERLVAALAMQGIEHPFEVQSLTIPDAIAGRDVCGRAPTGSGKTIAFGAALLARISRANKRQPTALILAPTRELAAQISRDLDPLARAVARRVGAIYGGVGYEPQRRQLNRGVDVLVACPGRLSDLVQQGALTLDAVETVVIDEADRMADMGFLPEVRKLLDLTPSKRQTLLFSATLDQAVGALTREYQNNPVRHETAVLNTGVVSAAEHVFWNVELSHRSDVASQLLPAAGPTIVFCRTRRGADRLSEQLERKGIRAQTIHGGRSQNQRDRALASFAEGRVDALIATDVAARGIHVEGVACVVHFDVPEDADAYTHRSGRTGRAGANGLVVSFVSGRDRKTVDRMRGALGLKGATTAPDTKAIVRSDRRTVAAHTAAGARPPQHRAKQGHARDNSRRNQQRRRRVS